MRNNQCSVAAEGREAVQQLELNCRACEAFDAVNAGGMDEDVLRGLRADPSDVDGERLSGGTAGGELQNMEVTARFL